MRKAFFSLFVMFALGCFSFDNEKIDLSRRLYSQIKGLQVHEVSKILIQGADPNYCTGEFGWIDNNPLFVIPTYLSLWRENEEQDSFPDVQILYALLNAGADINARPYVWAKIDANDNDSIKKIKELNDYAGDLDTNPKYKEDIEIYIADVNRLIGAFLEAGADPDMLGHPYPFSNEAIAAHITDDQAAEYFVVGTRPINEAIKKGIVWEAQVDLLLNYTELDEASLIAAQKSGDPLMIEKINRLWKIQTKSP
ncbi:MAG: hypothetical protein LBQ84_05860 [Flavobacteriaceae bacterium]|jgi:hypothetical protein|nr:hypothetical protein [Flavobacteriaceae bacterium]